MNWLKLFGHLVYLLKLNVFYEEIAKNNVFIPCQKDDIFDGFKTYSEKNIFLHRHFFPRIVLSKWKLMVLNLKIKMPQIFILKKNYEIDRRVRLKSGKIKKI